MDVPHRSAGHDRRPAAANRPIDRLADSLLAPATLRRAGVVRRALRRQTSRLRDPRRLVAVGLLILTFGFVAAGLIARGEAAGADARAYWAGVRIWFSGGDPYQPTGPFMPYVYAPWMLPLFAPWGLLPWDVAWFAWRGATILALFWTVDWAYRRRPLAAALAIAALTFPIAANLDTGNVTLVLTLLLFGAQFAGPRLSGLLWALAAWMKWVPAPFLLVLAPRARCWGLVWLAIAAGLSVATLPLTLAQLHALFGFGARPVRLDYLVLLWALVPWLWAHPDPLWWTHRSAWSPIARRWRAGAATWQGRLRTDPAATAAAAARAVRARLRAFLGLGA